MQYTIVDGYTDEPSGLGVPPYLGVYPRYIAGNILRNDPDAHINYLTIDDLRAHQRGLTRGKAEALKNATKTDTWIYSITEPDTALVLSETDVLVCIVGVQTPGKYLSAHPATIHEMVKLTTEIDAKKIMTGPAISEFGTQISGGRTSERIEIPQDYELMEEDWYDTYELIDRIAPKGALVASDFPKPAIAEIEISRGCFRSRNCSFCTEPLADCLAFRDQEAIAEEIHALYTQGLRRFRLGRTTCFYSYKNSSPAEIEKLFRLIWERCPDIEVLHIDNVNPAKVLGAQGEKITRLIVKYCTEGNIAAFGCETFDPEVVKKNNLNSSPQQSLEAIRIINKYGAERHNGIPRFLPGINILFGLIGENRQTHKCNLRALGQILEEGLMLRRINIRQVVAFPGTQLYEEAGMKFIRKNKKHYYRWREDIRQQIDVPMLQRVFPAGTVLKNVLMEIYDGNTTFGRQLGTYPVIIGIKGRHRLRTFCDVRIDSHMKRSLTGSLI